MFVKIQYVPNKCIAYKETLYEKIVKINISDENNKNKSVAKCVKCTKKIQDQNKFLNASNGRFFSVLKRVKMLHASCMRHFWPFLGPLCVKWIWATSDDVKKYGVSSENHKNR